ncbi:ATP-binding cassette sub-family A member 2-like isoform X2 [Lytechinus variegatus]|uniref:ATP-binding cassette sub-family A member 2-like isoform X2 n=1 Tax=Lytechinus variegatus TaxID=7654 RepID=UPI001BB216D3|nr:ATP-binding cassette sub-family A member 2-like isoform X2 [Lytechinus variegatus]
MGFMHQLLILLWKNWTLKRRSPFVLLLEILIPLTLFFILVSLRHHKPSIPESQKYYMAQPLPSSGVIPVMQVFCPTAVRDPFGLPDHPNSEVTKFLEQLDQLVNTNTIFTRKFSVSDISVLPDVFQDILGNQDSVEYKFASADDFPLSSILKDDQGFKDFLVQNLSLSQRDADHIVDSNISTSQLFKVLYGSDPRNASNPYYPDNATDFNDFLDRRFGHVKNGALFRNADPGDLYSMDGLVDILSQAPGLSDSPGGVDQSRGNMSASMQLAQYFEDRLLDPDELQDLTCNDHLGSSLYDTASNGQGENATDSFRERVCNHEESYPLFVSLSQELHDQIDLDQLVDKLNLTDTDLVNSRIEAILASKEVQKFARFQQTLQDVYVFAQKLPGDACPAPTTPPPPSESPSTTEVPSYSPTLTPILTPQSPSMTPPSPSQDKPQEGDLGTEAPYTTFADDLISNFTTNLSTNFNGSWFNVTTSSVSGTTPTPLWTTPTPKATKKPSPPPRPKTKQEEQKEKVALLYKLWAKIQYSVCGVELKVNQHLLDRGDVRGLKLTHDQRKSLSLLLHVLFSRPTILYSPDTPDVRDVIDKASDFIYLAKNISHSAERWMNISKTIREYLDMNTTQLALQYLGKMEEQLSEHPEFLSNSSLSPDLQVFITNSSLVSVPYIRNHLDVIDNAACAWLELTRPIKWDLFVGFPDEASMVQYALQDSHADGRTVFASVAFQTNKDGTLPSHTVYKIRQNSSFTDRTDLVRRRFWRPGANHHPVLGYYTYGFVWVQDIIDRAIIDKKVGRTVIEPGSYAQEFPYPCYVSDMFPFTIEQVMPMVMVISWVYSVAMLTQSIVYEKELRLKEVMKMMGLSNAVHWVAWFITSFLQLSVTTGALTAMLIAGKVLANSDPVIVWLFLTVYSVSVISFSFLVSSLFSKAKVAAACAGIIYFTSFVPCIYIQIREETWAYTTISAIIKSVASLSCTTAFGLGARYFALYEIGGVGVQWHTLNLSPVEHDDFNLLRIFVMLIIDIVLYLLLTWYIEGVHPGAYGLPRPWYFPVQPSYWFGTHRFKGSIMSKTFWKPKRYNHLSVIEDDQAMAMSNSGDEPGFEPEPIDLELGVSIENLTKIYSTGKKLAVNNLCLNLYEGQITSFLGHNGAGKTTTMSVLTGLFPPTSGTAKIYGSDIRTDMTSIRKSLGMCPQHNALFDKLTVEDHVWFYAQLKGKPKWQIKQDTDKLISDIGLTHKRNTAVHRLSGGMKRRLSVAIAFVGDSRTVILDEPTAGVDPCARRAIWDLLLKYKHGRTILLSTHHMDEADFLGDRIAIISHGQVKCAGSSLFLKNSFGDGYHLTVVKKPAGQPSQGSSESDDTLGTSFRTLCSESTVTKFIQDLVPGAYLTNQNLRELSYTLPFDSVACGHFPKLFTALDQKKDKLYISSYGLMDTTLEEVFLKVAENTGANRQDVLSSSRTSSSSGFGSFADSQDNQSSSGSSVFRSQSTSSSASSSDRYSSSQAGMEHDEMEVGDGGAGGGRGGGTFTKLWRRRGRDGGSRSSAAGDVPLISVSEQPSNHGNTAQQEDASQVGNDITFTRQTGLLCQLVIFIALIKKRLHHVKRNRKGLFSQLLLPAFFVTIAMTVALSAPHIGDLPPLILSPSQYHPFEYPEGNFIPYTDEALNDKRSYRIYHSQCGDAGPQQLTETFKFPAGIGASCILKTPFNGTLDLLVESANYSHSVGLTGQYYDHMCEESFKKGKPLSNYVPTPPSTNPHEEEEIDEAHGGTHIKEVKCSCSEDRKNFQCPKNVGTPDPPLLQVITSDNLMDVSGRNLSEYLLYTTNRFRLHRYGALSFGNVRNFVPPKFNDDVPTIYKKIAVRNAAMTWHNHKGFHSLPTYLSVMNNAILRANLDPQIHGNPSAYGISVINQPMNKTSSTMLDDYTLQETSQVLIAMFIIVAMSFVPASFVVFVVAERASKAKHLQFVSGVNPLVYWLSNFFWDMMNYLIPAACCVTILKAFDIPAYSSATNLPAVVILFLLYGFSITPMMYPASLIFKESSLAYVCLIVINLFIGITTICGSFLVELFNLDDEGLKKVYDTMYSVFVIFPNYCLGRGLMDLAYNDYMNEYYTKIGAVDEVQSPFRWDMLNRMFFVMVIEGVLAFAFTVLCEYGYIIRRIEILPCCRRKKVDKSLLFSEDEDVLRERQRVLVGEASQDLLRIENLTKIYKTRRLGSHLAVDGLCLGVPEGECFGLLGVNGAGKTTTFKMLCGDLGITGGDAYINKDSIFKKKMKAYKCIGYCPQFDALFDELTAREHLLLYARIKGVQQKDEKQVVTWALRKMALMQYADRPVGTYSGGNKRKLSTAIALLGNPQIIFMDEPTTGMDPHSRRFLWDCLLSIVQEGQRSVILTSHSMEECEVLCGRLAIMVNGKFKCLGSAQHLKNRYGDGYTVTLKVGGERPNVKPVTRWFSHTFPHSDLKEEHFNMVQYSIKLEHVDLAAIFSQIEDVRALLNIKEYSVSQTTLDDVFVTFAKQQVGHEDDNSSGSKDNKKSSRRTKLEMKSMLLDESHLESDSDDEFLLKFSKNNPHLTFDIEV